MFLVIPSGCAILKAISIDKAERLSSKNPGTIIVEMVFPADKRRRKATSPSSSRKTSGKPSVKPSLRK